MLLKTENKQKITSVTPHINTKIPKNLTFKEN